ncbi:MAG TPA: hypothetical protein VLL27_09125 [Solirubrobacterales bacterium]|nr:hypothetical protein [Solirubrobacterales bacterium]
MAQILVVADSDGDAGAVVYRERVASTDLESEHFSGQLVERVGWAVLDANELERKAQRRRRLSATAGRRPSSPPPASPQRRAA